MSERRTIITKTPFSDGTMLIEYVNWENLNQLLEEGKTPVFEDTGEIVPPEQYEELLKPRVYTLKELLGLEGGET